MSAEMQHIIAGQIDFSAYTRELALVPDSQGLLDLHLRMYSLPNAVVLTAGLGGGEDYRVYVSGRNVTRYVVQEYQRLAAAMPRDVFERQYLAGVDAYLRYATHVNQNLNGPEERAKAESLLTERTPVEMFATLGDRSVGWGGNLHAMSFAYRFISLEPISLASVWEAYVRDQPNEPPTLADLRPFVVLLSQGPAPSYEPPNIGHFMLGRLVYSLTGVYRNPLEPRLTEIAGRLRTLSKTVDSLRTTYLQTIVTDLEHVSAEVNQGQAGLQQAVGRIERAVDQIG